MSTLKAFLIILSLIVGQMNPMLPLTISIGRMGNKVESNPTTIIDVPKSDETEYKITGLLTVELDGYCTIDIPQSHWSLISSELTTSTQKFFKYKDGKTRLLMGYTTDLSSQTDVPGYIVQELASVDMTTNNREEFNVGESTWTKVIAPQPIDDYNVIVYYKLSKDGSSAFWMRLTKDVSLDDTELNVVLDKMMSSYNMYYIEGNMFETPDTGVYSNVSDSNNTDEYQENTFNNTVFAGRGGFVAGADISNNWQDMEVILDDVKIRVPCTVEFLLNNGYSIQNNGVDIGTKVNPNRTYNVDMINTNGTWITIEVTNSQLDASSALIDCPVTSIKIDSSKFISSDDVVANQTTTGNNIPDSEINSATPDKVYTEPYEAWGLGENGEELPADENQEATEEDTDDTDNSADETSIIENTETVVDDQQSIDSAETVSLDEIQYLNGHGLILPCGVTWGAYRDDIKEAYGSCEEANYNQGLKNLKFTSGNKTLSIVVGDLKGITIVTLQSK